MFQNDAPILRTAVTKRFENLLPQAKKDVQVAETLDGRWCKDGKHVTNAFDQLGKQSIMETCALSGAVSVHSSLPVNKRLAPGPSVKLFEKHIE